MKNSSALLNKSIQTILLYSIDNSNYSNDKELTSDKEKINFFFSIYDSEFNHDYNKKAYPNHQNRLANYLMGLPSCVSFPFTNYEILEFGKANSYEFKNEKQENKFIESWFNRLAINLISLEMKLNK